MTPDDRRWAALAHELRFHQLDIARQQAETWRTGLAALTALLTAVFILKGQDSVSTLAPPYQVLVVTLLAVALGLLLAATVIVTRAIAGPQEYAYITGPKLKEWHRSETERVTGILRIVPWFAVAGVTAVALAIGIAWLAPARDASQPLVRVTGQNGQACGTFLGISRQQAVLRNAGGRIVIVALTASSAITPVSSCD